MLLSIQPANEAIDPCLLLGSVSRSIACVLSKVLSFRLSALCDVSMNPANIQVLGGAGPAIAAVPLTVVWAGGAFYTLASGLGAGKVGPRGAVQRVGYTFFMAIADVRTPPRLMHGSCRCRDWCPRPSVCHQCQCSAQCHCSTQQLF